MIRTFALAVVLFISLFGLSASAGTIQGTVRDAKDTSAMIGVIITIQNSDRNAQTDLDGHYEFQNMADGTYTLEFNYVSYTKQSVTVTLADGGVVVQDMMLKAAGNILTGTTVTTTRRTNTEAAVLAEIRKTTLVVSGISAAQISRTMDRNAADVVKRIPGVTIQDDRFITVRGLADRYNTVWLNDAGAPSSETDKKAFSFDIIPSGLIDRILVFKTPSPELPGDFAGGMVKIYTTSIPDKNTYTIGFSSSYRSGSTGTDFFYNQTSSTDWLGYDNGVRSLPELVTDQKIDNNQPNIKEVSKSFGNDFKLFNKKQPLDLRMNASASNVFKFKGFKLGSTIGLTYSDVYSNYNVTRLDYTGPDKSFNYNDLQSSRRVNIGALANFAAVIGNSKIEFKNLYNQIGNAYVTSRTSNPDSFNQREGEERSYAMGYESRATYSAQLSGTHHTTEDTRKYTWTLGYTDLFKNAPNLRRIKYMLNEGEGKYFAQVQDGSPDINNGGGRFYTTLFENVYSFSHQFTQKFNIGDFDFDLNLGNYAEYKKRDFNAREIGYSIRKGSQEVQDLLSLPLNEIFADHNVGDIGQFRIRENTADYDKYYASNQLIASFASLTLPITDRFKIVTGVRFENNVYKLTGYSYPDTLTPEVTTNFLLPSLNATYNFSVKSLLRLAYGKTINRPEFRETAPFFFYDFDRRAGMYGALFATSFSGFGGDTLKVAQIHNIDLRYEFYPSAGEVIQVGGFYKHFKDPIQQVSYYNGDRAFRFINAKNAHVYGLEVDVRKNLEFLDAKFNTKNVFKNITLVGNLALSKSGLNIDTSGRTSLLPNTPLEGQSNYVVNTGVFYQSEAAGLQGSLLYNVYGPRAYSLGTVDDGSIGELAFHSLDLTLTKTIYEHYQINFGVQNLLDQAFRFVVDGNQDKKFQSSDLLYTRYNPGRYFTMGVKFRF